MKHKDRILYEINLKQNKILITDKVVEGDKTHLFQEYKQRKTMFHFLAL